MTTISNPVPRRSLGVDGGQHPRADRQDHPARARRGARCRDGRPAHQREQWLFLAILILTTVAIFVVYLQPWHIPIKYLVPGTIFLIAFQVIPVVATFATSFTNFGDGHRGSKQDAVLAIETASVTQVAGSAEYVLTIATEGDPASGDLVFLLYDPTTKTVQQGTAEGLTPRTDVTVSADGQGHRGARTDDPQHRRGCVPPGRHQGDGHPHDRRRHQGIRSVEGLRGPPDGRLPGVLRLRDRFGDRRSSTPQTRPADSSSARPARRWRRVGWSESASTISRGRSPTRPSPARSSGSWAGTSRSRSSR